MGRSGNDTIRLFDSGIATYEAEEGSDHFRISARQGEPTLFESVEACRQLAAAVMGTRSGQARLYLSQVQEDDEGLTVSFEYCLNGSQVRLEGGSAAQFLVRNGQIVQFTLRFRSYSDSGETSVVLPVRQARRGNGGRRPGGPGAAAGIPGRRRRHGFRLLGCGG